MAARGCKVVTAVLTGLIACCLLGEGAECAPLRNRRAFARALSRVAKNLDTPRSEGMAYGTVRGMPAQQIELLLGRPDEIRAGLEMVQYPDDGEEEEPPRPTSRWCYGVQSPGSLPTLGIVVINSQGRAIEVCGASGTPPPSKLISEARLRQILTLLDRLEPVDRGIFTVYDPLIIVQAVNRLQPLGKQRVLAILHEYIRVTTFTTRNSINSDCPYSIFPLLRLLFTLPVENELNDFNEYVFAVVDDVPLGSTWVGGNSPGIRVNGEMWLSVQAEGILRSTLLRPPDRPWEMLERQEIDPSWQVDDYHKGLLRRNFREAVLMLLRTVYRSPLPIPKQPDSIKKHEERWNLAVQELKQLKIRWNARLNSYTFQNGSRLPDEPVPRP
jgi:hypothetical protein